MKLSLLALALSACALLACSDDEETDGTGGAGATSSSSGSGTGASGGEPAGPGGAGGTSSGTGGAGGGSGDMALESSAFAEGMPIPAQYECENDNGGQNVSPPLTWTAGPAGTQSYAVILRDLDFNELLHWVIWDIPASATSLPEGIEGVFEPSDPAGAKQAPFGNSGIVGYFGPCSPSSVNTYQFTVYALDVATLPGLDDQSSQAEAEDAILAEEIASATLSGES